MRASYLVVLLVVALGCAPTEGGPCSDEGSAVCSDDDEMLVCEDDKWRAIPCRGPAGCTSSSERVVCDYSAARAGDACPESAHGTSTCTTADDNVRLSCDGDEWNAESCLLGCNVVNGNTVCI